jgi:hypothetical protein
MGERHGSVLFQCILRPVSDRDLQAAQCRRDGRTFKTLPFLVFFTNDRLCSIAASDECVQNRF